MSRELEKPIDADAANHRKSGIRGWWDRSSSRTKKVLGWILATTAGFALFLSNFRSIEQFALEVYWSQFPPQLSLLIDNKSGSPISVKLKGGFLVKRPGSDNVINGTYRLSNSESSRKFVEIPNGRTEHFASLIISTELIAPLSVGDFNLMLLLDREDGLQHASDWIEFVEDDFLEGVSILVPTLDEEPVGDEGVGKLDANNEAENPMLSMSFAVSTVTRDGSYWDEVEAMFSKPLKIHSIEFLLLNGGVMLRGPANASKYHYRVLEYDSSSASRVKCTYELIHKSSDKETLDYYLKGIHTWRVILTYVEGDEFKTVERVFNPGRPGY